MRTGTVGRSISSSSCVVLHDVTDMRLSEREVLCWLKFQLRPQGIHHLNPQPPPSLASRMRLTQRLNICGTPTAAASGGDVLTCRLC